MDLPGIMPIYEYRPREQNSCDYCADGFEVMQKIADPELTQCPQCGSPVGRLISAPSVPKSSPSMDADNIGKHGFTQYRRAGKGVYEKTAGKGPDIITDD